MKKSGADGFCRLGGGADEIVAAVKGRAQNQVVGGKGKKGLLESFCPKSGAVRADEQQALGLLGTEVDGGLHPATDIAWGLLPVMPSRPQPGLHLREVCALEVDLQAVGMQRGKPDQFIHHQLCQLPVDRSGSLGSQGWDQPGLTFPGFGGAGKKKDEIGRRGGYRCFFCQAHRVERDREI